MKVNVPLFLIGAPRSGTKLLTRLLNNHPDILLAVEFGALGSLLQRWSETNLKERRVFDRMFKDLTGTIYYQRNRKKRNLQIQASSFYNALTTYTIEEAMTWFIRYSASRVEGKPADTRYWGQKSPHLTDRVSLLKQHYPDARFIHLVRDVRNCAVSSRLIWKTDINRYAQRWFLRVQAAERQLQALNPRDRLTVRYEDLTAAPRKVMRGICRYLSIPFDPSCLRLHTPTENYGTARGKTEIIRQDDCKYTMYLSESSIRRIEGITFPLLKRFGYPYSWRGPRTVLGPLTLRLLQIKDAFHRLWFDIRTEGWSQAGFILRLKRGHFKQR